MAKTVASTTEAPSAEAESAENPTSPPTVETVSSPPPARLSSAPRTLRATDLIGSEEKLEWVQVPPLFFPGHIKPIEKQFSEGMAIFKAPLAWPIAAVLQRDVTLERRGKSMELASGEVLPLVMVRKGGTVLSQIELFCTRSRIAIKNNPGSIFSGNVNWGFDSLKDAQICLQDTDSDDQFDLIVAIADGAPIRKIADIEPKAFRKALGETIPGTDDHLTVKLDSVWKTKVFFDLEIVQSGETASFTEFTSGRFRAEWRNRVRLGKNGYGELTFLGLRFQVDDTDKTKGTATVKLAPRVAHPDEYIVIPNKVNVTYGY